MLQFFNIPMLFGALGASIPILIHLFSRRKRKIIVFSSLRFLVALEPRTLRWLRLKQRWLLVLRALILALVAVALARPVWRSANESTGGPGPRRVAVVIDASLSMQAGQRWAELKEQAETLQKHLTPKDVFRAFWIGNDRAPGSTSSALQTALQESTPQWQYGEVLPSLLQSLEWLDEEPGWHRELVIFSDFQSSLWTALSDSALSAYEGVVFAVRCGTSQNNLAVAKLELETQVYESGNPLRLSVHLANFSEQAVNGRLLRIMVNGNAVAQRQIEMAPESRQQFSFEISHEGAGRLVISAALENDDFLADDSRQLVLQLPGLLRTLIVSSRSDVSTPLQWALNAGGLTQPQHHQVSMLSQSSAWLPQLPGHDVVVMHNIDHLLPHETEAIHRFVRQGGGLLLIPGNRVDLRAWQRDLFTPLLGVGSARVAGEGTAGSLLLVRPQSTHAFWAGLFDRAQGPFTSPEIRKLITLQPGNADVLLETADGRPWLVGRDAGSGRVLLMASGLESDWSTLPYTGFFAALMHRALTHLGSATLAADTEIMPGMPLVFALENPSDNRSLRVMTPENEILHPTLELRDGAWRAEAGPAVHPGLYRLLAGDSVLAVLAVNPHPKESDLRPVHRRVPASLFANARLYDVGGKTAFTGALKESRSGRPLWPWIWFLVGFLVATEMLVARQRRNEGETGER